MGHWRAPGAERGVIRGADAMSMWWLRTGLRGIIRRAAYGEVAERLKVAVSKTVVV
jgi:hypothetical protein